MRIHLIACLGFFLPMGNLITAESIIPGKKLEKAARIASNDGVGKGYCGRGVWSVLSGIGFGRGLRSGDGHDWEKILKKAGWKSVVCTKPSKAPVGSVLVYNSDRRKYGKNKVGTLGGIFGHVELVAVQRGRRVYVSDATRQNAGGSVPKNFTGRAWLPPGSVVSGVATTMSVLGTTSLPGRRLDLVEAERGINPRFNLGSASLHPEREMPRVLPRFLTLPIVGVVGVAGVRVWPGI